jgi:hypothetical protein
MLLRTTILGPCQGRAIPASLNNLAKNSDHPPSGCDPKSPPHQWAAIAPPDEQATTDLGWAQNIAPEARISTDPGTILKMVIDAKDKKDGDILKEVAEKVRTILWYLLVTYRK